VVFIDLDSENIIEYLLSFLTIFLSFVTL